MSNYITINNGGYYVTGRLEPDAQGYVNIDGTLNYVYYGVIEVETTNEGGWFDYQVSNATAKLSVLYNDKIVSGTTISGTIKNQTLPVGSIMSFAAGTIYIPYNGDLKNYKLKLEYNGDYLGNRTNEEVFYPFTEVSYYEKHYLSDELVDAFEATTALGNFVTIHPESYEGYVYNDVIVANGVLQNDFLLGEGVVIDKNNISINYHYTKKINPIYIKQNGSFVNGNSWVKTNGEWKQGTPWIKKNGIWVNAI